MKLQIWCEVSEVIGDGCPNGFTRELSGWGQNMFFVVYRPIGEKDEFDQASPDYDEKDLVLYVGFYEKEEDIAMKPGEKKEIPMEQIKVLNVKKAQGEELEVENWKGEKYMAKDRCTLTIESEKGTFYLPDPYTRKKETATFNGQPIVCWS